MTESVLINYALVTVSSFLLGFIVGWSSGRQLDNLDRPELRRLMAVILLTAYVISVFAEIRLPEYKTPVLLHGIMGATVGYLFSAGENNAFNINIGR